jgi:bHLH factor
MAAMQNKRKREAHDMAGGRAAPGMAQTSNEFEQHYLQTDDGMDGADGVMDFAAALAQHGADPNNTSGGDGTGQSASDTAAAAMAQYHTMTVPQSTEQSFMTGANEGDKQPGSLDQGSSGAQHRNSSFGDFDTSAIQSSPNGDTSPTSGANAGMSAPKPPVGSEEWHKVRKDNHKEGKPIHTTPILCTQADCTS